MYLNYVSRFFFLSAFVLLISCEKNTITQTEILYVGTYSVRGSEGIYTFQFDRKSSQFKLLGTNTTAESPNFLAVDKTNLKLYSVNQGSVTPAEDIGSVSSFQIDQNTGSLSIIDESSSYGKGPCHISLDEEGKWLFISHYTSGSITALSTDQNGIMGQFQDTLNHMGSSVNERRQKKPHLHSILPLEASQYFFAADLGIDQLRIYQLSEGKISPAPLPFISTEPGSGPRHFCFLPNSPYLYIAEELTSTVSVHYLNLQEKESRQIQWLSTLPEDFTDESWVADIHLSPDGKFLYVSNRGHNSLAIFSVDQNTGKLTNAGYQETGGNWPRNFLIDSNGTFILVAHQHSDDIMFFNRDTKTGLLKATDIRLEVPSPVCLKMISL